MSKGKELIKNTAILMLAKLATNLVSFLLMPLYTSVLSTAEYGESDIYATLGTILLPLITLQLEMSLFRFFITGKDEEEKQTVVTSSLSVCAVLLGLAAVIYLTVSSFITVKHRLWVLLYYSSMTVFTVLLQAARAKGDNIGYGAATFLSSCVSIVLNLVLVVFFRYGVRGILIAQIGSSCIASLYLIFRTRIFCYFRLAYFRLEKCAEMLRYSVPMIINQLSSWVINYSDRLIILKLLGIGVNGIYAVANKFSNILNTFYNMYMVAWTENVIRTMDEEGSEKYFSRVMSLSFDIYLVVITGVMNLLPLVFGLLINEAFSDAYMHIPFLLAATFFYGMAATVGSIYVAYGKTKSVSMTTFVSAVVNIIIHLALVWKIGLYAASVSTLITFFLLFIYRLKGVKAFCLVEIDIKKIAVPIIIAGISWAAYCTENIVFILIGFVLNIADVLYLVYCNKELLRSMLPRKKA